MIVCSTYGATLYHPAPAMKTIIAKRPAKCSNLKRSNVITARGRQFSDPDIKLIRRLIKRHFREGRTFISVEVCKALDWKQPNGWPKDRACREVLRILEARNLVQLPKSKSVPTNKSTSAWKSKDASNLVDTSRLTKIDLHALQFFQVKGTKREPLWNSLVRKYHYLGFNVFVGRALKYLVYYEDRVVAALGVCDPAWSLAIRDELLGRCGIEIDDVRYLCLNNGRFLIMPWVKTDNLASFILSTAVPRIIVDWQKYYLIKPLMLETFVDSSRFKGTCYKAANWIYIGQTKGYKKSGNVHQNSQKPKMIFVYPLKRGMRSTLVKKLAEPSNALPHR
ncbi:MAG TPA: Druantia anti-phage system protein DruA [Chlamydiales bacterium]|jgi:hypothetical protein|nr:Druantia anti-phage system protein DruA [Chlamydiales bacterium]